QIHLIVSQCAPRLHGRAGAGTSAALQRSRVLFQAVGLWRDDREPGELGTLGLRRAEPLIAQEDTQFGVHEAVHLLDELAPEGPTAGAADGNDWTAQELSLPGDLQLKFEQQPFRPDYQPGERHIAAFALAGVHNMVALAVGDLAPVPAIRGDLEDFALFPDTGTGFRCPGPELTGQAEPS